MRKKIYQKEVNTRNRIHRHELCDFFHKIVILITIFLLFIPGNLISSVPPHPRIEQKIQNGEISMPYHLAKRNEAAQRGINLATVYPHLKGRHSRSASLSNFKALVILIQFSDKPAKVSAGFFDTLLFTDGSHTLKSYYQEISYGQMDIITVNLPSSTGWMNVPQTYNYYVNGQNGFGAYPHNAQKMVEDAITAVDSIVDFSQYDNDGDGYVDALYIIHCGSGAEYTGSPNDIWSHQWTTYTPIVLDGVEIYTYMTEPEYWISPGDMTCGVYAHEMAHAVFGLPDLYDYDKDSKDLGRWSLMASGSWSGDLGNSPVHPDPWSRIRMGFISPIVIISDLIDNEFPPIEDSAMIFKYIPDQNKSNEYFLLENRQKIGFDKQLRGEGLLIYHIEENQQDNCNQWYPECTDYGHYKVALEQADGLWNLEHNNNAGDAGDPYPGISNNTIFNGASNPNSENYNQENTNLSIINILQSNKNILASINIQRPSSHIEVNRLSVIVNINSGDSSLQSMSIQNKGSENLDFQICNDSLVPWLSIIPDSGRIIPGTSQMILLLMNSYGLTESTYETEINLKSNDSLRSIIKVPISMTVKNDVPLPGISINLIDGWNIISNPITAQNSSTNNIFPMSASDFYSYTPNSGYQSSNVIIPGRGYWVRFDSAKECKLSGNIIDSLAIDVEPGWNLIGTILSAIPVKEIRENPVENIASSFFGYQKSYCPVDSLYPGKGYWVQVKEKGQLILKHNHLYSTTHTEKNNDEKAIITRSIEVRDAVGESQTLLLNVVDNDLLFQKSELPPLPPTGVFDVRFAPKIKNSNGIRTQYVCENCSQTEESIIMISSAYYPITLRWNNKMGRQDRFNLIEMIDGEERNIYTFLDSSTIILTDPRIASLILRREGLSSIAGGFSSEQNFPNPFNPTTAINFNLPMEALVNLKIYNSIGQEVAVIIDNKVMNEGMKNVVFEAGNLASGVYLYRLTTTYTSDLQGKPSDRNYVEVKKMLLLR